MSKKLISVVVPVYNEAENIRDAYTRISSVMRSLTAYDYEIVFFDDGSEDGSRGQIEALCAEDDHVKAVFYVRNYGYAKTVFYCMQQAKGDAAVIVHCDLQNPPEEIPKLVEKWGQGADVVLGVKNKSRENPLLYALRTVCYFLLNFVFGVQMIPHATEFELFDRSFINVLAGVRTQNPYLRGLVRKYAARIEKVYYVQDKRRGGRSHFGLRRYYEFSIGAVVSMSKCVPRRFILFSAIAAAALLAEFFFRFLPAAPAMGTEPFWTGLMLRFGVFALMLLIMLVSVLFEFVIVLSENGEQAPMIREEKRIGY